MLLTRLRRLLCQRYELIRDVSAESPLGSGPLAFTCVSTIDPAIGVSMDACHQVTGWLMNDRVAKFSTAELIRNAHLGFAPSIETRSPAR